MALIVAGFGALTCAVDCNWYAVPEAGPPGITTGKLVVEGSEATATLARDGTLSLQTPDQAQFWHFAADTVAQSFVATQRHFVDCVRSGTSPETSGLQTLQTMALVFGAYRSSEEHRVVSLSEFDSVRDGAAAAPLA
jgi:predicted dehydrogenase